MLSTHSVDTLVRKWSHHARLDSRLAGLDVSQLCSMSMRHPLILTDRIGLWFIHHALYLKYYVLFIGVATALYFAWDISGSPALHLVHSLLTPVCTAVDDLVFRKPNPCCPKQLEYRFMTRQFFSPRWYDLLADHHPHSQPKVPPSKHR